MNKRILSCAKELAQNSSVAKHYVCCIVFMVPKAKSYWLDLLLRIQEATSCRMMFVGEVLFCMFNLFLFLNFILQLQLWLESPRQQLTIENALPQIEPPHNSEWSTTCLVICTVDHVQFPHQPWSFVIHYLVVCWVQCFLSSDWGGLHSAGYIYMHRDEIWENEAK